MELVSKSFLAIVFLGAFAAMILNQRRLNSQTEQKASPEIDGTKKEQDHCEPERIRRIIWFLANEIELAESWVRVEKPEKLLLDVAIGDESAKCLVMMSDRSIMVCIYWDDRSQLHFMEVLEPFISTTNTDETKMLIDSYEKSILRIWQKKLRREQC